MRFHLVDRIDVLEPGKRVRAVKLTSHSEDYWREGRMPPPLVLEALCQAGNWLVLASTDLERRAALLSVDRVRFGGPVRPGDTLVLDGEVESIGTDRAALSGTVTVDGRQVLAAETILCALLPTDTVEDTSTTGAALRRLVEVGGAR